MKAVIDTNIIISSFINETGLLSELIMQGKEKKFDWLISNGIYMEIAEVLSRPIIKEKYQISTTEATTLLSFLATSCIPVSPQAEASLFLQVHSNDQKDDKVLKCAVAGKADYLVTGDKKDLLALNGHSGLEQVQIVSVREFLNLL
jgi:uncharacterized protein